VRLHSFYGWIIVQSQWWRVFGCRRKHITMAVVLKQSRRFGLKPVVHCGRDPMGALLGGSLLGLWAACRRLGPRFLCRSAARCGLLADWREFPAPSRGTFMRLLFRPAR